MWIRIGSSRKSIESTEPEKINDVESLSTKTNPLKISRTINVVQHIVPVHLRLPSIQLPKVNVVNVEELERIIEGDELKYDDNVNSLP